MKSKRRRPTYYVYAIMKGDEPIYVGATKLFFDRMCLHGKKWAAEATSVRIIQRVTTPARAARLERELTEKWQPRGNAIVLPYWDNGPRIMNAIVAKQPDKDEYTAAELWPSRLGISKPRWWSKANLFACLG